jgi:hypothetical protein
VARIVQIPISFNFRTVRFKWKEVESKIVGLEWGPTGDDWDLRAKITGHDRIARLESDDVPERLWNQCVKAVRSFKDIDDWDNADQTIERVCAGFHPRLLLASEVEDRLGEDEDDHSLPADAWQLRDDFLRLASSDVSSASALAFLNRWGRWETRRYALLHGLVRFQQKIRRALVSPPDEWLSSEFNLLDFDADLDLERKSEYPYFTMDTVECKSAISITVTLDLLRQVRFETCARQDCGQPFPITSRHKRKFCSQYCGHLESVRRARASERNASHRKGDLGC